jgi:hypothetical protein
MDPALKPPQDMMGRKRRLMRLLATALLLALIGGEASTAVLDAYRDKRRPLVVIAPAETDPALARQRAILAPAGAALAERDITVIWVVGDRVTASPGAPPADSAAQLRTRYGKGARFTAVLVGKDGGTKLSSEKPIDTRLLIDTIDAMPMRRDEMAGARP